MKLHFERGNDLTTINTFSHESSYSSHRKIISAFLKIDTVIGRKIVATMSVGKINNKIKSLTETFRL